MRAGERRRVASMPRTWGPPPNPLPLPPQRTAGSLSVQRLKTLIERLLGVPAGAQGLILVQDGGFQEDISALDAHQLSDFSVLPGTRWELVVCAQLKARGWGKEWKRGKREGQKEGWGTRGRGMGACATARQVLCCSCIGSAVARAQSLPGRTSLCLARDQLRPCPEPQGGGDVAGAPRSRWEPGGPRSRRATGSGAAHGRAGRAAAGAARGAAAHVLGCCSAADGLKQRSQV